MGITKNNTNLDRTKRINRTLIRTIDTMGSSN